MSRIPSWMHKGKYENANIDTSEMRRRREEESIQLRKEKREQQLFKRRNVINRKVTAIQDSVACPEGASAITTPDMLEGLMSPNVTDQIIAIQKFRKCLSKEPYPFINEIISLELVPKFVEFLRRGANYTLMYEAAWVLSTIASGTSEQVKVVVESGAVPTLIQHLDSDNSELIEQVVWGLGKIAGDSAQFRDYELNLGVMAPLLRSLNTPNQRLSMLEDGMRMLANLCRGAKFYKVREALPTLNSFLYHNDTDVMAHACWAITYLSDGPDEEIQEVIDAGVCKRLVELLSHNSIEVVIPALHAVGNIVTGNNSQTQVILNYNVLPHLMMLLQAQKESLKKDSAWTVSNIMAGTSQQIQAVIDANIVPVLIHLLETAKFETRKEAAWAITNATFHGNLEQIKYLVRQGCIRLLCGLLTNMDNEMIQVSLTGIEKILSAGKLEAQRSGGPNPYALLVEECYGFEKTEILQSHDNMNIHIQSSRMIEQYFEADDENLVSMPVVDSTTGQYNFNFSDSNSMSELSF